MIQNWIQRGIDVRMGTTSSTDTQANITKFGGTVTRNWTPRQKIWKGAHQLKTVNQVKYWLSQR